MTDRLRGKVAIVTGAAGGIGAATARRMVEEGASVVLADIDGEAVARTAADLGAIAVTTDVTDEAAVAHLVEVAVEHHGRLDVLHNNAVTASADDADAVETPDHVWHETFAVVVMAAVYGCRHAIPVMVRGGGGAIVNTSSGAARSPTGSRIAYGSTKAALETFSAYTASIHGPDGIRSNVVAPGFVLTPATRSLFDAEQLSAFGHAAAAGRVATPEDVAEVVVFLASDEAAYVSGQVVAVNGGGARGLRW
jgi:NAD(P)-dependent dehydrogenase (short-subunit alcohol dehydrogenase family)